MTLKLNVRVGIDIGGVIIDRAKNDGSDTSFFSDRYLEATPVEGVFEAVKAIVDKHGQQNVYLVSRAGTETERKSKEWLHHHDFFRKTGMNKDNLRFCRERADKAPICQKLRITHFIDDRAEVLSYLFTVPILILFGTPEDVAKEVGSLDYMQLARTIPLNKWSEIANFIVDG